MYKTYVRSKDNLNSIGYIPMLSANFKLKFNKNIKLTNGDTNGGTKN